MGRRDDKTQSQNSDSRQTTEQQSQASGKQPEKDESGGWRVPGSRHVDRDKM